MTPKVKEEISKKYLEFLSLRAWMLVCFSILPLNHQGNVGGGGSSEFLSLKPSLFPLLPTETHPLHITAIINKTSYNFLQLATSSLHFLSIS